MSHHAGREILRHICKLSSAYKPFQLTILVVIKTVPVAIGGIFAALAGAGASIYWGGGLLADFRMETNKQIADLKMDVNKQITDLRTDLNSLLLSHGELRNNVQVINETLKRTQKAQEDCATLQAARLEIVKKGKNCNILLRSPCVWSNNINSMINSRGQCNLIKISSTSMHH